MIFSVETYEKVVRYHSVTINKETFDLDDLYGTILAVEDDNAVINNKRMAALLKSLEVIDGPGSSFNMIPARPGPKFEEFKKIIANEVKKIQNSC